MFRQSLLLTCRAVLLAVAWMGAVQAQAQCPSCGGANTGPGPGGPLKANKPLLYKVFHPLKGCECYTHNNSDYKCGSWRSEATFVFGGCRSFFGEPCFNGPPGDGSCPPPGCLYRKAFVPGGGRDPNPIPTP